MSQLFLWGLGMGLRASELGLSFILAASAGLGASQFTKTDWGRVKV